MNRNKIISLCLQNSQKLHLKIENKMSLGNELTISGQFKNTCCNQRKLHFRTKKTTITPSQKEQIIEKKQPEKLHGLAVSEQVHAKPFGSITVALHLSRQKQYVSRALPLSNLKHDYLTAKNFKKNEVKKHQNANVNWYTLKF